MINCVNYFVESLSVCRLLSFFASLKEMFSNISCTLTGLSARGGGGCCKAASTHTSPSLNNEIKIRSSTRGHIWIEFLAIFLSQAKAHFHISRQATQNTAKTVMGFLCVTERTGLSGNFYNHRYPPEWRINLAEGEQQTHPLFFSSVFAKMNARTFTLAPNWKCIHSLVLNYYPWVSFIRGYKNFVWNLVH